MAGFVANVNQWANFERRFAALLFEHDVDVFHTKKLKHSKGAFKGWPVNRKVAFHSQMLRIIESNVQLGFGCVLHSADYFRLYRSVELPRKIRKDSEYGLTFRHCMYFGARHAKDLNDQINFVL